MRILGPPSVGAEDAEAWAASREAATLFLALAPLYWRYAPERGVRPEVAYAQSAKETAFGRFGGVITSQYRNPCGLKTADGGDNGDPGAHQRFPTWDQGVIAHLDHLALYAGALGYPRVDTPDPRHFPSVVGLATTVEDLGGRWAPAEDYGTTLRDLYISPLLDYSAPDPGPPPVYVTAGEFELYRVSIAERIENLVANDDLTDKDVDELRTALGELQRATVEAGRRLSGTL